MKKKIKNKKGSVLVFSLLIMMIALIIGIGMMTTSATSRRSTLSSTKTVYSFQRANDGIEYAFYQIKIGKDNFNMLSGHQIDEIFPTCGSITADKVVENYPDGSYELSFFEIDGTGAQVSLGCNDNIKSVELIKSIGTYQNTSRVVDSTVDLSDANI